MEIKGAKTRPPASSELFTISNEEEKTMAGQRRHKSIAPTWVSDEGNRTLRISFEKAISPTSIGEAINDEIRNADSSKSRCNSKSCEAIALVNIGRYAIEIGEIIAKARFSIGTASVV